MCRKERRGSFVDAYGFVFIMLVNKSQNDELSKLNGEDLHSDVFAHEVSSNFDAKSCFLGDAVNPVVHLQTI